MTIPVDIPEEKVPSRMKAMRALLLAHVSEEDLKMNVCRGIGGETMVSALLKFIDSTLADRAHDVNTSFTCILLYWLGAGQGFKGLGS